MTTTPRPSEVPLPDDAGVPSISSKSLLPLFQRSVDSIQSNDLEELRALEEGWFVEFKLQLPDSQKLAKSLSSFANAHGGLLVIGIQEDAKTRRMGAFAPMSLEQADEAKTRIRQAAEAHLQPCPIFHAKSIEVPGFSEEQTERWVVLVRIEKGDRAPYLHSSGSVYTRKGDSASPLPLTDLGLFERLWFEGKRKKEALRDRVTFLCTQNDSKLPRFEIVMAMESPVEDSGARKLSLKEFQDIAQTPIVPGGVPLMNNVYPLDTSYVARHVEGTPVLPSPMWDYDYRRGIHFISLPLATHIWDGQRFKETQLGHERLQSLADYLASTDPETMRGLFVVDLTPSLFMMAAIFHMVTKIYRETEQSGALRINARAGAMRGSVVYAELPRYADHLKSAGLPHVHREIDFLRPIDDADTWLKMSSNASSLAVERGINLDMDNSLAMFAFIGQMLGVSRFVTLAQNAPNGDIDDKDLATLFSRLATSSFLYSATENPNVR
jgi:hypothetical protein